MDAKGLWPSVLFNLGAAALVIGAVEPLCGSIVILIGGALATLGAHLGDRPPRFKAYRTIAFAMILFGFSAIWVFTALGGIGGSTGRSFWWGLLILPYLVGWTMSVWAPDSPRWVLLLGIAVGLWHHVILVTILQRVHDRPDAVTAAMPAVILALTGLVTILGCIYRLTKGTPTEMRPIGPAP